MGRLSIKASASRSAPSTRYRRRSRSSKRKRSERLGRIRTQRGVRAAAASQPCTAARTAYCRTLAHCCLVCLVLFCRCPLSETRRDPGIPNDWPFKAALLSEIEKQKAAQAAIDSKKRADKKERQQQRRANPATFHDQSALPASLTTTATTVTTAPVDPFTVRSRQTLRLLRQLVQQSQLILFCLDARDPMGSRWQQLESKLAATENAPPLVFVLTHCDCVPADVVDGWVRRLSRDNVTVAFVTDHELDSKDRKPTITTTKKLTHHTTDALIQLLHSYTGTGDSDVVNVAVMGFENTGKSSVMNAVMRAHWCGVSGHAGYTKDVQMVRLGERVRLYDSPGVPSLPTHPGPHITLPLDKAKETVVALVDALDPSMVLSVFRCASFASAEEFLTALATKQGKFAKGGTPNTLSAARTLIRQWNEGAIPHYTTPQQPAEQAAAETGAEEEGGLAGMFRVANEAMVAELKSREESVGAGEEKKYIVLEESLFADQEGGEDDEEEEDEEMDGDEEEAEGEIEEEDNAEEEKDAQDADMDMDEQDDEAEAAVEEEQEVFVNPSPSRLRTSRQQRSPGLSITTTKPSPPTTTKQTTRQPLLTPSRTQRSKERRTTQEERKEADVEAEADGGAMEDEDDDVVSEPDSPAKNTRSHRKKTVAPSAPPIAAITTPRRSARAKSGSADQQAVSDTGSAARTRSRRK